jgi:hypothetical protein
MTPAGLYARINDRINKDKPYLEEKLRYNPQQRCM